MLALLRYTPTQLLDKLPRVLRRRGREWWEARRDRSRSSYALVAQPGELLRYLPDPAASVPPADYAALAGAAGRYVDGFFDYLGSGWVPVRHGMTAAGLEGHRYSPQPPPDVDPTGRWLDDRLNPANRAIARAIWQLVDADYRPIDWHLDFKSGYRWNEDERTDAVPYGDRAGVDVKVPWELTRMHHLPILATAYAVAQSGAEGFRAPEVYARAFRNQVLDFLATNPPRFGVNWHTAMLTGIRSANFLVAYDLFRAAGAVFDNDFTRVFRRSLIAHGRHTLARLEWWDFGARNNHYLANLAGLIFLGAYLPCGKEPDAWLAFGYRELLREMDVQFEEEGSGFEASVGYHAFSAEMMAWMTGMVMALPPEKRAVLRMTKPKGLPRDAYRRAFRQYDPARQRDVEAEAPFPAWYLTRLARTHTFLADLTRPDGHIAQLGDNDSGRFLKLCPPFVRRTVAEAKAHYAHLGDYAALPDDALFWDEDLLDYRTTRAPLGVFAGEPGAGPEAFLMRHLTRSETLPDFVPRPATSAHGDLDAWRALVADLPEAKRFTLPFELPFEALGAGLDANIRFVHYPAFGVFVWRSAHFFMSVRCGPAKLSSNVGHPHEDQLAVELFMAGAALVTDPGTYVYTPLLERRNQYRAATAHFVPACHGEADATGAAQAAFALSAWQPAEALAFGPAGFVGRMRGEAGTVYRLVTLGADAVRLTDFARSEDCVPDDPAERFDRLAVFQTSVGYGKLLRRPSH